MVVKYPITDTLKSIYPRLRIQLQTFCTNKRVQSDVTSVNENNYVGPVIILSNQSLFAIPLCTHKFVKSVCSSNITLNQSIIK